MSNEAHIKKINPALIKPDGTMKPFQEQLLEYKYDRYPKGIPLVVSPTSSILGIGKLSDLPIAINQAIIRKVEEKHSIAIENIICLEEQLRNHVLAFDSLTVDNAVVLVLDQRDNENNHVICALHNNVSSVHVEVNAIRSIYGKGNIINLLENTYQSGKQFYPNKRTDDWVKSVGVQFPKEIINHLSLYNYSQKVSESQDVQPKSPEEKRGKHI